MLQLCCVYFVPHEIWPGTRRNIDKCHCQTYLCAMILSCGIACLDFVGFCINKLGEGLRAEEPVSEIPVCSSVSASDAIDFKLFNSSEPEMKSRCSLQDPDVL